MKIRKIYDDIHALAQNVGTRMLRKIIRTLNTVLRLFQLWLKFLDS